MTLPEITEVRRLTVKPGDVLVVRTDKTLTPESADHLHKSLRAWLGLPDDVRILVLDRGMSLEVLEPTP